MKEYQARTKDLTAIRSIWEEWDLIGARKWFQEIAQSKIPNDSRKDYILVLSEWESESEANRERVQYIQEHGLPDWLHFEPCSKIWQTTNTGAYVKIDFIQWLDSERNAPNPTVRVIPI